MIPRASSGSMAASTASGPLVTPRFAPQDASVSMSTVVRSSSSRRVIDGRMAAATSAVGSTLYSRPTVFMIVWARSSTALREFGSTPSTADRRAEGDERTRLVADREAGHLGDLAAERALAAFHPLTREHVVLDDQVVGHGGRNDPDVRMFALEAPRSAARSSAA